jgi:hypothetical protein
MRLARAFALGVVLLAAAVAVAGVYVWRQDAALSAAPERRPGTGRFAERESTVALGLTLPFAALAQLAETAVPPQREFAGEGGQRCMRALGAELCAGARYRAVVARAGPVTLARTAAGALGLSVPLSVTGQGELTGDAALLRLRPRQFSAGLVAEAALQVDIGADWCPALQVEPSVRWTVAPRVEIADGVALDVQPLVEPAVRAALARLPEALAAAFGCEAVRREAARLWRAYAVPVDLAGAPANLVVVPRGVGFTGLTVAADHLRLGLAVRGTAELRAASASAPAPAAGPLPALERAAPGGGRVDLAVPVRLDYPALSRLATAEAARRPVAAQTPVGAVQVAVSEVELYPAGERVAARLRFSADAAWNALDARGTTVVAARPTPAPDGRRILLEDLAISREVSNVVWRWGSAALADRVRAEIAGHRALDLGPRLDQAATALAAALADPARTGGVRVRLADPRITLAEIVGEAESLVALVRIEGGLDAELTGAPAR